MPIHDETSIGALLFSKEERRKLARASIYWKCEKCGNIRSLVPTVENKDVKHDLRSLGVPAFRFGPTPPPNIINEERQDETALPGSLRERSVSTMVPPESASEFPQVEQTIHLVQQFDTQDAIKQLKRQKSAEEEEEKKIKESKPNEKVPQEQMDE